MAEDLNPVKIYDLPKGKDVTTDDQSRDWVAATEGSAESTARTTVKKPYPVGDSDVKTECPICEGEGMVGKNVCSRCNGTGYLNGGAITVDANGVISVNVDGDTIQVKDGKLVGHATTEFGDGIAVDEDGVVSVKGADGVTVDNDGISFNGGAGLVVDPDTNKIEVDFDEGDNPTNDNVWPAKVVADKIEEASKKGTYGYAIASGKVDNVGVTPSVVTWTTFDGSKVKCVEHTKLKFDDEVNGASVGVTVLVTFPSYTENSSEFILKVNDNIHLIDTTEPFVSYSFNQVLNSPSTYTATVSLEGVDQGETIPTINVKMNLDVISV